ncbi:MAG TPA: fluoride efflux transporter CrcB [Devosia sp.]|nr:fluoride efflux transporter CrcB [Devosia sp.]
MNAFLLVGAGGALGAMGRYGVGVFAARSGLAGFPYATLGVNILGSLLMGLLIGALAKFLPGGQNEIRLFFAVGLLGGFTTFSAFSLDAIVLLERGQLFQAGSYIAISVIASIFALFVGLLIMRAIAT